MNIKRFVLPAAVGTMLCLVSAQAQTMGAADYQAAASLQHGQAEAARRQADLQLHARQDGPGRLLRGRQALRLYLVRDAAQHARVRAISKMIAACPHVAAIPMIRLPDAQEWHIQHATDIGVLGVIVPTVDDVDRAREAAKWARYPPWRGAAPGAARHRPFGASTASITATPSTTTCWWSS